MRIERSNMGPFVRSQSAMPASNAQFLLAAHPDGMIQTDHLRYHEVPVPSPRDNEALVKVTHISLDPAMRGWMENRGGYMAPLKVGELMRAGCIGEIIESRNPSLPEGRLVSGTLGMQTYAVTDGTSIPVQLLSAGTDPEVALGMLGGTGMTAYFGLLDLGIPKPGQTVVVSGAAGATGSIAGQIARIKGCRVVGLAGTDEKCQWLTGELGFDVAINYKTDNVRDALKRACPNGIDVYFDNVGGDILDACLALLAMHARVVICGGISRYNEETLPPGPTNYFNLVFKRARMEGFIVIDYAHRFAEAATEMQVWIKAGLLTQRTTVIRGFEHLPQALVDLFSGVNIGKLMVCP